MAAYYKSKGMSLYDGLLELFAKYGTYKETITSITLKGIDGAAQIKKVTDTLRANSPKEVSGAKVIETRDYSTGKIVDITTGAESETGLPKSNVLYYVLDNDTWFCVRPSGTEPKIKVYFGSKGKDQADVDAKIANAEKGILAIVDDILK
jgi:phosphoglucomutase